MVALIKSGSYNRTLQYIYFGSNSQIKLFNFGGNQFLNKIQNGEITLERNVQISGFSRPCHMFQVYGVTIMIAIILINYFFSLLIPDVKSEKDINAVRLN